MLALHIPIPLIFFKLSINSSESFAFNSFINSGFPKKNSAKFCIYLVFAFDNPHLRIAWDSVSFIWKGVISLFSNRCFSLLNIVDAAALESCCPEIILTSASKFGFLLSGSLGFISFIILLRILSSLERCNNAFSKSNPFFF